MRNFYYVVTFNMSNPVVKTMLNKQGITAMSGFMIDFKMRSKLFISYTEAVYAAHEDFDMKLKVIYPDATDESEHNISQFIVSNPAILQNDETISALAERFSGKYLNDWDENCCSVIFFADNPEGEEEMALNANSWMFKYEIFFSEDAMEIAGNGDFIFSQMNVPYSQFNSTYH